MATLTLEQVLQESEFWEFRQDVLELARMLKAINDQAAKTSADVAAQLFRVAYSIDLDAEVLKRAIAPLADVSDQIELATDMIIDTVSNRREAYIRPPNEAMFAAIKAGEPLPKDMA